MACEADIPGMVALGKRVHEKIGFPVPYEPEAAQAFISETMQKGVAFLSERGMIGGAAAPLVYGTIPAFCVVGFWHSEDGAAFRLLGAFEKWAARNHDLPVAVSALTMRMRRVLERRGYKLTEGVMTL